MSEFSGVLEPDRLYSCDEFARVAGVSIDTLRRLIRAGNGPIITHLSTRRRGIRGRHAAAWLDSRASNAGAEAA